MSAAIKNLLIITRHDTPHAVQVGRELCDWLHEKKIVVYHPEGKKVLPRALKFDQSKIKEIKLVLVLGGDGTYLSAVQIVGPKKIPFVGVNMGSLGFLTENRVEDLYRVMEKVFKGQLEVRKRSLLAIEIKRGKGKKQNFFALNDAVIERGESPQLINLSIACGDELVTETKADGMIIATPTGSTAYNLAAGGPILHPQAPAIVITPICPHSLTTRPLIFSDQEILRFRVLGKGRRANMTVDGQVLVEITDQDEVSMSRHAVDHQMLRDPGHHFYGILRDKLKFGDRA